MIILSYHRVAGTLDPQAFMISAGMGAFMRRHTPASFIPGLLCSALFAVDKPTGTNPCVLRSSSPAALCCGSVDLFFGTPFFAAFFAALLLIIALVSPRFVARRRLTFHRSCRWWLGCRRPFYRRPAPYRRSQRWSSLCWRWILRLALPPRFPGSRESGTFAGRNKYGRLIHLSLIDLWLIDLWLICWRITAGNRWSKTRPGERALRGGLIWLQGLAGIGLPGGAALFERHRCRWGTVAREHRAIADGGGWRAVAGSGSAHHRAPLRSGFKRPPHGRPHGYIWWEVQRRLPHRPAAGHRVLRNRRHRARHAAVDVIDVGDIDVVDHGPIYNYRVGDVHLCNVSGAVAVRGNPNFARAQRKPAYRCDACRNTDAESTATYSYSSNPGH